MDLNLPIIENQVDNTNTLPFEQEYISYVLKEYLINGKSAVNIDQEYFPNGYNNTGILASIVLSYFGLVSSTNSFDNKGIYNGESLENVITFLNQKEEKYKKIASGLAMIEFMQNYSEKELGEILKNIYNTAEEKTKITSLYLFGIKYANIIEKNNYNYINIIKYSTIPESLQVELSKAIRISKYVSINEMPKVLELGNKELQKVKEINNVGRTTGAYNKIYYGVPGCGKSHTVNAKFKESEYCIFRTTFHPEYTNSDFVGQIIPTAKGEKVEYIFHPGAFTNTLEYALNHETEKVCLIIEEINRGNASAIFGDIFQLLDRDKDGNSKYKIFNGPIQEYLVKCGLAITDIYIPSNMWIIATMNTSDQNVFTLDTAFKRRWKMEYIKNEFANDEKSNELKNKVIRISDQYPNITWEKFVSNINKYMLKDNTSINAEDKQLGVYFVTIEEVESQKEFAEKILSYLWEDVAKLDKERWFGNISSYEKLLEEYEKNYLGIFDQSIINELFKNNSEPNETTTQIEGE